MLQLLKLAGQKKIIFICCAKRFICRAVNIIDANIATSFSNYCQLRMQMKNVHSEKLI